MNNILGLKHLLFIVLGIFLFTALPVDAAENPKTYPAKAGGKSSIEPTSKPGYSVDGRTSASVLAAKRSHQVAREDEIGLSVFSGLFAIAVIGFFSKKLFDNK